MFRLIKVALGGVVVLIGAGFAAYSWWQTQKSVVFFDNTLDQAVTLRMDGNDIGHRDSFRRFGNDRRRGVPGTRARRPERTGSRSRVANAAGRGSLADTLGQDGTMNPGHPPQRFPGKRRELPPREGNTSTVRGS